MNTNVLQEYKLLMSAETTLDILGEKYPNEWKEVSEALLDMMGKKETQNLSSYIKTTMSDIELYNLKIKKNNYNLNIIHQSLPQLIKAKLLFLALNEYLFAMASSSYQGTVKLNRYNGWLLEKMFFQKGLERKLASYIFVNIGWKFITQKGAFLSLIQQRGIYCFYTKKLIKQLADIIKDRHCLEIGAGDGTLARFLSEEKLNILATDDYSWTHQIQYPASVKKMDAKTSLETFKPECVICSWPPSANLFEKYIFENDSVQTYIMIGSKNKKSCGNWETYKNQTTFQMDMSSKLSSLVMPSNIGHAVYIFQRSKTIL